MNINPSVKAIVDSVMESGTPVNAVAASGTLTISGVAIDAETVTVGDDTYEFAADTAQSVTSGNIAVDITSYTTASQGTLTIGEQVTADDTMTIGDVVYTFVADGTAASDGEINVGSDEADGKVDIVAAINGTDGINTANPYVTAADFSGDDCVLTAIIGGTAGDAIATTETFTNAANEFDAATLGTTTAGADCTAANAVTAIVAASSSGTEPVTLADGAGDTVTATYDTKGIIGNTTATTETMANGAWGDTTLGSGVDGTQGKQGQTQQDSSYWYLCIDDNTISDTNWRRFAVGSAY